MKKTGFLTLAALAMLPIVGCAPELPPEPQQLDNNAVLASIEAKIPHHVASAHILPVTRPGQVKTTSNTAADLQYYGGRVISNVQVEPVMWTASVDPTLSGGINAFYQAAVSPSSAYWAWLTEYNTAGQTPVGGGTGTNQTIGAGTVLSNVTITPSVTGTTIDDTQIQAELKAQIKAGKLPKPTADAAGNTNTYYPIFFPNGYTITLQGQASCAVFCAYHGTIAADATAGTPEFYYGVHMDLGPGSPCNGECGGDAKPFNDETSVASHELGEATTDAEVGLSTVIGPPLAWYDTSQGEIGDICNAQQGVIPGTSYVVQKLWSNQAGACIVSKATTGAVTAAITAPAAGSTVTGTVNVTATATTTFTGDTIKSVAFSVDGAAIGTATTAPYTVAWDTTKVANGSHSITALATDSGGHTGSAPAVAVTVSNGGGGSVTATITAPAAGSTVSGSVAVTASAATTFTGDTIKSVAFSVDGAAIGTATAAPYTVTWDTTKIANGGHSITAVATDSGGHTGNAPAVTVTVSNGGGCASVTDPGSNGSIGTALALSGTCATITGKITGSGDSDYFKVSVAAGATLAVALTPPAGALFFLVAYDQNGKFLGFGVNSLNVKNSTGAAVTRYFAVEPLFGSGAYAVKATW